MTWDPLGRETLGEDWVAVAVPEVVVAEEITEAMTHYLYM